MSSDVTHVNDANFEGEVLQSTIPVLVDFWAEWCQPCHALAPVVQDIAQEYRGRLKVVKLNVDENLATPGRYNIRGIPTLLLFKKGEIKDQIVGAVPKEAVEKVLERHLTP
ncbi:MAG TPA: thioredoxin [Candidatus Acidoferrales bacterium]